MTDSSYQNWLQTSPLPRNEARLLLQKVTGLSHAQIIAQGEERLPEYFQAALNALQQRRMSCEPMAYILGEKEFYGRVFAVSPAVLIPRPETEHLLEAALSRLPEKHAARVWDLGCGSGIVAISLKLERPELEVWASDISAAALEVAQNNAENLGAQIEWAQGDWFACDRLPEKHSCDVLVSNPPYIEQHDHHLVQGDLRFEPQGALTDFGDGLGALRSIIAGAAQFLREHGSLWLEHGFDQGAAVRELLQAAGFREVETLRDYAGLERVSGGFRPR
ncbi:MAG: peptide chain release factor N(5)-glutamine methyltransferase [Neisseria sp.]|nr:peptide chain release factor N(5)-glutamine methyltransferase [Neisseria sp.]